MTVMDPFRGEIRFVHRPEEFERAFAVRRAVFIEEQHVPESLEHDEYDSTAVHVMALEGDRAVGTGRLARIHEVSRIGRMAVLPSHRGRGVGRALLLKLLETARTQKIPEVHLAAQLPVVDFYAKLGFMPYGEIFEEAGLLHRMMKREVD
jgi:predicted GNAT family N-acyltransferase